MSYLAEVSQYDANGWLMIRVPDIGITQARRIGEVEYMARDLIAITLDVPISTVKVRIRVVEP